MSRTCARTGLRLVVPSGDTWRVARWRYGPLQPQRRPSIRPSSNPDLWKQWQRWDVPDAHTTYTATQRVTCFAETLQEFRRPLDDFVSEHPQTGFDLSSYLDETGGDPDVWAIIANDWLELGDIAPWQLPPRWREDRGCFRVRLPQEGAGWFVDVTHPDSIESLRVHLATVLRFLDVNDFDLSLLTSGRRDVTCAIATWIHGLRLDDDTRPHGIRFASRLDGTESWAVWLRRLDRRRPVQEEPSLVLEAQEIAQDDVDLTSVCRRYGLAVR